MGLAPFLRLQAATVRQYRFSEWGAASLDLAVSSRVTNSLRSLLGAQFDAALDIGAAAPGGGRPAAAARCPGRRRLASM